MSALNRKILAFVRNPTDNLWGQLFKYVLSGGAAFCVDSALLYLLTEGLGVYYLLSSAIGFSTGLVITYLLSIVWIFDYRSRSDRRIEFLIFLGIGLIGLGLTSLFMWIFTSGCSLHFMISKILTTVLVTGWNFIAKKILLFSRKNG